MSTPTSSTRTYVWHRELDASSQEQAVVSRSGQGLRIEGHLLAVEAGSPVQLHYALDTHADGRSRALLLRMAGAGGERRLTLRRDDEGRWWQDGSPQHRLAGCDDIDLGFSPATNALPLARMLQQGLDQADICAAWVKFPSLDVEPAMQRYTRLDAQRWEYRNLDSGFTAELAVDDWAMPSHYVGIWRQLAVLDGAVGLRGEGFADALVSAGPHPSLGSAAADLAWLEGGWRAIVRDFADDGTVRYAEGEWWFAWVLEGRALQDVWISPTRVERSPSASADPIAGDRYGTTLRTFAQKDGRWQVRWVNPASGAENRLEGVRQADRMVLLGAVDGRPIRWQFIDIEPDRFTWQGFQLANDGEHWRLQAQFDLQRIR